MIDAARARSWRRVSLVGTAVLTLCACTSIGERPDLAGWNAIGDVVWQRGGNTVSVRPQPATGYLVSPNTYGRFRLTVEFRIEDDTNSGIFVGCTNPVSVDAINPMDCLEVNIWDNHPNQDFRTGSVVTRVRPAARVETLGRWKKDRHAMQRTRLAVEI